MMKSRQSLYTLKTQIRALKKNQVQIGMGLFCFDLSSFDLNTGLGFGAYVNFALCDGQNGRPDLRDRFIAGYNPLNADYDTIGNTGGEAEVTLTESQMPSHTHTSNAPNGNNGNTFTGGSSAERAIQALPGGGGTNVPATIDEAGGDQPHENRPPYYVAAFIMRYR